jgi:hypothetical protein
LRWPARILLELRFTGSGGSPRTIFRPNFSFPVSFFQVLLLRLHFFLFSSSGEIFLLFSTLFFLLAAFHFACDTGADPPCHTALGGMVLAHIPLMSCSHFSAFSSFLPFPV